MYLIFIRIMSKFRYYQWRILHVRLKYVMILICNPALRQQAHNLVGWYKAVYKYLYYYYYYQHEISKDIAGFVLSEMIVFFLYF